MNAYCFVDGAHLREIAKDSGHFLPDPRTLAVRITYSNIVQHWGTNSSCSKAQAQVLPKDKRIGLSRVIYYDGRPDDDATSSLEDYWRAVELLHDTEIAFGVLRGKSRRQKRQQKGVDTLIAVDMLEGSFNRLFQVAILISGDADFVPVVDAVRRRGVMVVVAGEDKSVSDDLKRRADRFWPIDASGEPANFPPLLSADGRAWSVLTDAGVELTNPT